MTAYEHAIDTLRDVGSRLPTDVPSVEWPSSFIERVADDFADGFDAVKHAVVPAATTAASAAVGAGASAAKAAGSRGRVVREHPVLAAVGIGVAVALVIWIVRRRRDDTADRAVSAAA